MPGQNMPSGRETLCVVVGLIVFLVLNLLTASRYPFVWIDEVMYSDPAFNLVLGQGFRSTAWYAQTGDEFWAGNVPLHSMLLFAWLKVSGISITAVRSLNYFYVVTACLLLWWTSARLNLISTARHRLWMLALVLGGYSLIFSYRSGRPDCIGLLAMSAMFWTQSVARKRFALPMLFFLGAALPWMGLQLLPMLAVAGVLLVVFAGRENALRLAVAWAGAACGLAGVVAFYKYHGVWEAFVKSVGQHTGSGFFGLLLGGNFRHSNLTPKDFSFILLFAFAALLALHQWRRGEFKLRSPLGFGIIFSVVLTAALLVSGKFPTYYGWMTYVPLSVCVCAGLSSMSTMGVQCAGLRLLLAATLLIGIGPHLAAAASDWSDRNHQRVERLIRDNTSSADWIYCDYGAFYASKLHGAKAFAPTYLAAIQPEEKSKITALVIHPRHFNEVTNVLGGVWIPTGAELVPAREGLFGTDWRGGFLAMQNYRFTVYRRAP